MIQLMVGRIFSKHHSCSSVYRHVCQAYYRLLATGHTSSWRNAFWKL